MGTERYPKGRKPGKMEPERSQETSDPYRARQTITAGEEARMRQTLNNDYGKKPAPMREHKGMYVNPMKTVIHK